MTEAIYSIPACVRRFITAIGYPFPAEEMQPHIEEWRALLSAEGDFWDYRSRENGIPRKVHRRTIHPAARVANEWASLLMNDKTTVSTEDQACNGWLRSYMSRTGFMARGQAMVKKAFALGTAAWALWLDTSSMSMQVRRYDARMIVPLSWDDDGVSECAFCSRASYGGERCDQVQMHIMGADGYHIVTAVFDGDGRQIQPDGVLPDFATGCPVPTFAIVKPAIENTRVDMSPYGESVYADAVDAMKAVDLCYDALMTEVDLSKLRVFMSDMLIEYAEGRDGVRTPIPFGRDDAAVFRKVSADSDLIQAYAPAMRTSSQVEAYRIALQTMGDLCGFGLRYFDIDDSGGVKTATEVSADNSALMRNIRKHENALGDSISQIAHAMLFCAREHLGESLPDEGEVSVSWDDSIITDTAADKAQDMAELNITMNTWEYRMKWYGEDEETAKANVPQAQQADFLPQA